MFIEVPANRRVYDGGKYSGDRCSQCLLGASADSGPVDISTILLCCAKTDHILIVHDLFVWQILDETVKYFHDVRLFALFSTVGH